jgi:hypothetical protein
LLDLNRMADSKKRLDLSNWIIHFVHDRNIENEDYTMDEFGFMTFSSGPDGFKFTGEPIYLENPIKAEEEQLDEAASAYEVLRKIITDGYIKASWSYRSHRATIYGPKQAVCFTEMPLYGLLEYAKSKNPLSVGVYCIALLRDELFQAGARTVIYGLSGDVYEAKEGDPNYHQMTRNLANECGLGIKEQYRYVATNLNRTPYPIDWTHEREWRWADIKEIHDVPGLPLIIKNPEIRFSKIIVMVKSIEEAEDIIEILSNLYHSSSDNYESVFYDQESILSVSVLALEELTKYNLDSSTIKFEDLPLHSLPKVTKVTVTQETMKLVTEAITEANEISLKASKDFLDKYGDNDMSGFAHVVGYDATTEITQALVDLKIAHVWGDGYYHIYVKTYPSQSLNVEEAGARAAATFLEKTLGQSFSVWTRLD